jgi:hypothetical protein
MERFNTFVVKRAPRALCAPRFNKYLPSAVALLERALGLSTALSVRFLKRNNHLQTHPFLRCNGSAGVHLLLKKGKKRLPHPSRGKR